MSSPGNKKDRLLNEIISSKKKKKKKEKEKNKSALAFHFY